MSASADIQTKTHTNVLAVPINAVTTREANDSTGDNSNKDNNVSVSGDKSKAVKELDEVVFIVNPNGTVKKQKVKTDIQDINYIQVMEGLKEGDEVVTGPYDIVTKTLKNSSKVKIVPKAELFDKKK